MIYTIEAKVQSNCSQGCHVATCDYKKEHFSEVRCIFFTRVFSCNVLSWRRRRQTFDHSLGTSTFISQLKSRSRQILDDYWSSQSQRRAFIIYTYIIFLKYSHPTTTEVKIKRALAANWRPIGENDFVLAGNKFSFLVTQCSYTCCCPKGLSTFQS